MVHRFGRRMVAFAVTLALVLSVGPSPSAAIGGACIGMFRPVPGRITALFAPVGRYEGHWGVDLAAEPGEVARSAGTGTVSFSGVVAGNRTITVDHGGGLRSSYSFLAAQWVGVGRSVAAGQALGTVGAAHAESGLHFSLRIDGIYVDPTARLRCRPVKLSPALHLIPDGS